MSTNDTLRGLLMECRGIVSNEVEKWDRMAKVLPVSSKVEAGLLKRIDAALAEPVVGGVVLPEPVIAAFREWDAIPKSASNFSTPEKDKAHERLIATMRAALNGGAVAGHGDNDWSIFVGYLIDKCEGQEVAEENLQWWLSEMLADPHYGALFRREKQPADQPSPLALAIEAVEEEHGGLRAAGKALGVDHGYLSRLKSGEKLNPSDDVLRALGLERVTYYRAAPAKAEPGEGDV